MPIESISVSVVGAPYKNDDGSNRQFEIMLCDIGEPLDLRPEPKNKFDEHAIGVWTSREVQIGYINSERAPYLKGLMRGGRELFAIFQEATPWGAVARIGIDHVPALPKPRARSAPPRTEDDWDGVDPDYDDWSDELPPEE